MTSEQRQKRAERNRRYYQRRRSAENADETVVGRLSEGDGELRQEAPPTFGAESIKTASDGMVAMHGFSGNPLNETCPNGGRSFNEISKLLAPKTSKTLENMTETGEPRPGFASEIAHLDNKTTHQTPKWHMNALRRRQCAVLLLLLALVSTITFCLINEANRYYVQHDPSMALLKAVSGELILLYLALLSPRQWHYWLTVKGLMLVTFGYLIWIISMGLLLSTSGDVNKIIQTKAMIGDVERQIEDKRSELGELTKSGWLRRARKVDEQLTGYQQRLFELRSNFALVGNDRRDLIVANMISLVLFRVILMMTNVVAMGRIRRILIS